MKWLGCLFPLLVVNSLSSTACAQDTATTEPACGALGPSSDKVAIAHIAAMIERPENVAQLLQNLKLAHEKALLLDPAFYDDNNLTKFFGGTKVTWSSPKKNIGPASTARDIEVAADTSIFPQLVINLTRSCEPISKQISPNHFVTYSTRKHGSLEFQVAAIPGFTVGAVRAVLGRETRSKLSDTFVNDEFGGPQGKARIVKGQLDYENRSQPIDFEKNVLTFLVKLDPHPDRPIYEHLNDNDGIEHVSASQLEK